MSKANLPGLTPPTTGNVALDRWIQSVTETIQVREGARGDKQEQVLTRRDLADLGLDTTKWARPVSGDSAKGVLVQQANGSYAMVSTENFSDALRSTKLYRDLSLRIDDASRFDGAPDRVKSILLQSLADEAAARGAAIRNVEYKLQSSSESMAYALQEVTASVNGAAAGVRDMAYANATANRATAGKVTQLTAALDGTGSATIEESMTVIADRTDGLRSQYMLKMSAGNQGAVAGMSLMASEDPTGATETAFVVEAGKFALVAPINFSQDVTPSAASIGQVWYSPTTKVYKRSTSTGTGGWSTFTPSAPFGVNTTTGQTFINGSLTVNSGGAAIQDGVTGPAGPSGPASTTPGPTGTRGTIITKIAGGWLESTANAQIAAVATSAGGTPTTPIRGDIVSYAGGAMQWDQPGYALAWSAVAAYIDGSLIVTGTISANKIGAGNITTATLDTSGYGTFSGATGALAVPGFGSVMTSVYANAASTSYPGNYRCGVVGYAKNISFTYAVGVCGYSEVSTTAPSIGVYGGGDIGGKFVSHSTSGTAIQATGNVAVTGNLSVSGSISPASFNAATLGGIASSEFAKYVSHAMTPTPTPHTLRIQIGSTGTYINIACSIG